VAAVDDAVEDGVGQRGVPEHFDLPLNSNG
jgi:hypothetical protein